MSEQQQHDLPEVENMDLTEELNKLEDEINTLKQVLNSKEAQAAELRRKLGIGLGQQVKAQFETLANSETIQKTSEKLNEVGDTIGRAFTGFGSQASTKLSEMKQSPSFQSFEQKMGSLFTGRPSQQGTPSATSPTAEPTKQEAAPL